MSRPFQVYRLQQLDSQLDRIRSHLRDNESALADDSDLRLARENVTQANKALEQARNILRNAEFETQQQRIKIELCESTLYGGKVRNPKELKDLENEVAALKRYLVVLEEHQFEAMLAEEAANTLQEGAAAELETILASYDNRMQALNQDKKKLEKDLKHLEEERQAAAEAIPAEDLSIYNQLRQTRRGVAVAKVVDRACAACGSTLNATLLNAARSPNQLNLCDACGRILYLG